MERGEFIQQLGDMLGVDPSFTVSVQSRGQDAVIDRAEMTDESGAMGRMLGLVQHVGMFIQDRASRGRPAAMGEIADVTSFAASQYSVNPELATRLVGSVLEVFQMAARKLAEEGAARRAVDGSPAPRRDGGT